MAGDVNQHAAGDEGGDGLNAQLGEAGGGLHLVRMLAAEELHPAGLMAQGVDVGAGMLHHGEHA